MKVTFHYGYPSTNEALPTEKPSEQKSFFYCYWCNFLPEKKTKHHKMFEDEETYTLDNIEDIKTLLFEMKMKGLLPDEIYTKSTLIKEQNPDIIISYCIKMLNGEG